jgi:hypothetical protein
MNKTTKTFWDVKWFGANGRSMVQTCTDKSMALSVLKIVKGLAGVTHPRIKKAAPDGNGCCRFADCEKHARREVV